jgi:hypothetical protein
MIIHFNLFLNLVLLMNAQDNLPTSCQAKLCNYSKKYLTSKHKYLLYLVW